MSKQDKYIKSARDRDCTVRIPGVCNFNNETTVSAHIGGGGMGAKASNIHIAYCCSDCHDLIDGRTQSKVFSRDEIKLMHLEGVVRTQIIMIEDRLLKL